MAFTKSKGMYLAVMFIVIAVYNVVVFVIPFIRGEMFWTAYGFTMAAILLSAAVGLYVFGRESLKSKFYSIPLLSVIRRYLIAQIIIGLIQMILPHFYTIPFQYAIALNVILLGICLVGLIIAEVGKDKIEQIDAKIKEKVFYIKSLQVDVEGLVDRAADDSIKKVLKDLAETIRYSDPMSSPQLATIENKIEGKTAVLAESVEKADWETVKTSCNELQQLFAERNRKCKILK